jgi:hypothetical protein
MTDPAPAPIDPVDHLNLARHIAWRYRAWVEGGYPEAEAVAFLGLVQAARTYNPASGRWPTYAGIVITNALRMAGRRQARHRHHEVAWEALTNPEGELRWPDRFGAEDPGLAATERCVVPLARLLDPLRTQLRPNAWRMLRDCARYPEGTQSDRARRLGLSRSTVNRLMGELRRAAAAVLAENGWE